MSDRPSFDLLNELRFWVARFAVWFCGPAHLFWASPEEWEEYISIGQAYQAEDDAS